MTTTSRTPAAILAVPPSRKRRQTTVASEVAAGCFTCDDGDMVWAGANAQAVAARHHDVTGHTTWCHVNRTIRYGAVPK